VWLVWYCSCGDGRPARPSRAPLGSCPRPRQLWVHPTVTFAASPSRLRPGSPTSYNSFSESLPNRAHQERHEVHLHAVCPQRKHSGIRREVRQPPNPSRNRNQPSRRHSAPRNCDGFALRGSAAQLALGPASSLVLGKFSGRARRFSRAPTANRELRTELITDN
jgi:hypothetical protein